MISFRSHQRYINLKVQYKLITVKQNFELRLVIWDCEEIPLVDASGCVDLYITARLNGE